MRMGLVDLSVMDFSSVSKIASNYPVKELSRRQRKREPSTQSRCQLQVHSTLPILHQAALRARACLSVPNDPTVQRGPAHRDLCLSHHPGFATETSSRYMQFLFRSGGLAKCIYPFA